MKRTSKIVLISLIGLFVACGSKAGSSDVQRDQQDRIVSEGRAQTGMPAIKNFFELKLVKHIYELRDQGNLTTYSYYFNEMTGKFVFFCHSIGYPLPYSAQYSAPESMQHYYVHSPGREDNHYGAAILPQPEPNGLYLPPSSEASWVLCKDPDPSSKDLGVGYSEPRLVGVPFKMPCSKVQDGVPGDDCYDGHRPASAEAAPPR